MQESKNLSEQNTGISGDEKLKIYDMASNTSEWSTETSTSLYGVCVNRGGFYNNDSATSSSRRSINDVYIYNDTSFRLIL